MDITYDSSLSAQQRQWFKDGVSRLSYPLDSVAATVTVEAVPEPTTPGHQDAMCTLDEGGGVFTIQVRDNLDDPDAPINAGRQGDLKLLFQESAAHEVGHVVAISNIDSDPLKTTVAAMFVKHGATGEGVAEGTLADWSPDAPWEDRIEEAVAEVFKDSFLPPTARQTDNQTNWELKPGSFDAFMAILLPATGGGTVAQVHELPIVQTTVSIREPGTYDPGGPEERDDPAYTRVAVTFEIDRAVALGEVIWFTAEVPIIYGVNDGSSGNFFDGYFTEDGIWPEYKVGRWAPDDYPNLIIETDWWANVADPALAAAYFADANELADIEPSPGLDPDFVLLRGAAPNPSGAFDGSPRDNAYLTVVLVLMGGEAGVDGFTGDESMWTLTYEELVSVPPAPPPTPYQPDGITAQVGEPGVARLNLD